MAVSTHIINSQDRIRRINPHAPMIWTDFCKVDSRHCWTCHSFLWRTCWEKNPNSCNQMGLITCMTTLSRSFPGLELNANRLIEARVRYQIVWFQRSLGSERLQGEVRLSGVHKSLSGGFASDVISGSDIARDTWQDGEGRECRFVSIEKEMKQKRRFRGSRWTIRCRRGLEVHKRLMVDVSHMKRA